MRSICLCLLLAAACGKKTDTSSQPPPPPGDKPAAPSPAAAAPAAPPSGGPLTAQKIMAASSWFKAFEPWDPTLAKVQAQLGPPSRIKHSKVDNSDAYEWAAMDGDSCAFFSLSKMDGKLMHKQGDVASGGTPMLLKNDGTLAAQRNECLDAAKSAK